MTNQEINEIVARGLGWVFDPSHSENRPWKKEDANGVQYIRLPAYCTDIRAAWEIIEHLKENIIMDRLQGKWRVLTRADVTSLVIASIADTASMAICLAFLATLGKNKIIGGSI